MYLGELSNLYIIYEICHMRYECGQTVLKFEVSQTALPVSGKGLPSERTKLTTIIIITIMRTTKITIICCASNEIFCFNQSRLARKRKHIINSYFRGGLICVQYQGFLSMKLYTLISTSTYII